MMRYAESITIQNERKAEKTMLADFGIEPKPQRTLTELQIAAYAKRKSEARKIYEWNQKAKRGNAT